MKQAVFRYPVDFVTLPEYTAHAGQVVQVVGKVPREPYQLEPMFKIRALDGWEGFAFESELILKEIVNYEHSRNT